MISKPLLECRGRAADVNFRVVAVVVSLLKVSRGKI